MQCIKWMSGIILATLIWLMPVAALAQAINPLMAPSAPSQQSAEPAPDAKLEEALRPIIRRVLADQAATDAPSDPLEAAPASPPSDPFADVIDALRNSAGDINRNATAIWDTADNFEQHAGFSFQLLTDLEGWPVAWAGLANLALMLVGGLLAGYAVRRLLRPAEPIPPIGDPRILPRMACVGLAMLLQLAALAAFVAAGFLLSLIWFPENAPIRILLIGALAAAAFAGLGRIIGRCLFMPNDADCRIPVISDDGARRWSSWFANIIAIAGVLSFSGGIFSLLSMPPRAFSLLSIGAGLLIAGYTAWVVFRGRARGASGGGGPTIWAAIGLALFLVCWLLSVLSGDPTRPAAVCVLFGAVIATLYLTRIRARWIDGGEAGEISAIPMDPEEALPPDAATSTADADEPPIGAMLADTKPMLLARLAQFGCIGLGAMAFLHVAGVDMLIVLASTEGQHALAITGKIAIVLAVAAVCWSLVEHALARVMERERRIAIADAGDAALDEDGLGGIITSRFGTLLPLVRGFVLSLVAAVTCMVVLSSLGIDIGPLIAGAGVVGIAIGFGAQALVRDIISGVFFLIDDAFRVGEYVEFGEIRGQVEKISVRSMRLRHHRGAIHTVPFGELRSITNYNRDWSIYKQEFRLPFDADSEAVRKIIKKVGLKLLEHPDLGPKFIQPLKSQGIFRIDEGAFILRTKFMCKPREQFVIRKTVFHEVNKALNDAGIGLAKRRVQIDWPEFLTRDGADDSADDNDAGTPDAKAATPPAPTSAIAAAAIAGAAGLIATTENAKPIKSSDEP